MSSWPIDEEQFVNVPTLREVVVHLLDLSPEEAMELGQDLLDLGYFDESSEEAPISDSVVKQ